jgi:hypothetical protein
MKNSKGKAMLIKECVRKMPEDFQRENDLLLAACEILESISNEPGITTNGFLSVLIENQEPASTDVVTDPQEVYEKLQSILGMAMAVENLMAIDADFLLNSTTVGIDSDPIKPATIH